MAFHRSQRPCREQLFLSLKGGTGKTTLSASYGLLMAKRGYRVLFVDLDPQGHLTRCVGLQEWQFDKTLYHVLVQGIRATDVLKKVPGLNACVIPSDISLSATELALCTLAHREWRLVHALSTLKKEFDLLVLDSAPTISLLNLNAILTCRDLIIPILPDSLSLHALAVLLKTLSSAEVDFGHRIENIGILLNRFVPDDRHCLEIQSKLQRAYRDRLLKTVIHECHDFNRQSVLPDGLLRSVGQDHPDFFQQPFEQLTGARLTLASQTTADIEALAREIGPARDPTARKQKPKA
jgi:chromosome partitioning protein